MGMSPERGRDIALLELVGTSVNDLSRSICNISRAAMMLGKFDGDPVLARLHEKIDKLADAVAMGSELICDDDLEEALDALSSRSSHSVYINEV